MTCADCESLVSSAAEATSRCSSAGSGTFVPHVRQNYNWDCGLACVLMVLNACGIHTHNLLSLHKLCDTTSIWTVDLAHLLRRFGLEVIFLTTTIGANPDFVNETFYAGTMQEDNRRVEHLFQAASTAGISVCERSLSLKELQDCMRRGTHVSIALVDKHLLEACYAEAAACLLSCTTSSLSYAGHYIVISGYDPATDAFQILDPAASHGPLQLASTNLEAARKSFGTDEDLLLVPVMPFRGLGLGMYDPSAAKLLPFLPRGTA